MVWQQNNKYSGTENGLATANTERCLKGHLNYALPDIILTLKVTLRGKLGALTNFARTTLNEAIAIQGISAKGDSD